MTDEISLSTPQSVGEVMPKMALKGTVKRIELFGAFVDLGVGQDGLLHISQLGQPNVRNVEDVVKVGDEITVYVVKVDAEGGRIALSMVKPPDFTWNDLNEGQIIPGKVVRIEGYGVFIDIGAERPAMIHVSELSDNYVTSPGDVVKMGDVVQARIIKLDKKKRQIDMSLKSPPEPKPQIEASPEDDDMPTAMELALREAMTGGKRDDRDRRDRRDRDRRDRIMQEREDVIARTLRSHNK